MGGFDHAEMAQYLIYTRAPSDGTHEKQWFWCAPEGGKEHGGFRTAACAAKDLVAKLRDGKA